MAIFFSETVAAHLSSQSIGAAILGRFTFVEEEYRLWLGDGRIEAGGETWDGIGQWGGISSISSGSGDAAVPVSFTLSGVDPDMIASVRNGAPVRGQPVTVYIQFFHGATGQPLDAPAAIWSGTMDRVSGSASDIEATLVLDCEGLFAHGSKPGAGLLTQEDQSHRFPGDLGCEFVTATIAKNVPWPGL